MFIHLNSNTAVRENSPVHRPFKISVDADIPHGSTVVLVAECVDPLGMVRRQTFLNPVQEVLPTPVLKRIWLGVRVPHQSLGVPFIYAVSVEGNGWRHTYDAQTLFDAREDREETKAGSLRLISPATVARVDRCAPAWFVQRRKEDGPEHQHDEVRDDGNLTADEEGQEDVWLPQAAKRAYLTLPHPILGSLVSISETQKPYVVDVDGGGFGDSCLRVTVAVGDVRGQERERVIEVRGEAKTGFTTREELPVSSLESFRFGLDLRASSDGIHPTALCGIALEGDRRRFYLSAADLVGEAPIPDALELIRFQNSPATILTLKSQPPKFFEFPSAMTRLCEMFQRGELNPEFLRGQPLYFGPMMVDLEEPDDAQAGQVWEGKSP